MSARRKITVICAMVLAMCITGAALTLRRLDRLLAGYTVKEVLYIPSPQFIKGMSLGYPGLMADIYWTRAVQYFGAKHHVAAKHYDLLYPLLDITTTLDPHLLVAYEFGSIFLAQQPPEGAGQPDKAIALIQRGIRENSQAWRLYYHLGYIQYEERQDYKAASEAFLRGSELPGALPWMKVMAAAMAQHGGEIETARMLWTNILQSTNDELIRINAIKRLRALQVDEDVARLDHAIQLYREKLRRPPAAWTDLISLGWLRGIPVDPLGQPYRLMPGGRVQVQNKKDLPFIHRGLPPGEKASLFAPIESNK
jgi:hypothetical protein